MRSEMRLAVRRQVTQQETEVTSHFIWECPCVRTRYIIHSWGFLFSLSLSSPPTTNVISTSCFIPTPQCVLSSESLAGLSLNTWTLLRELGQCLLWLLSFVLLSIDAWVRKVRYGVLVCRIWKLFDPVYWTRRCS